ncbi:hypothetical protein PR001_g33250 [Phytophthora rubi]|uniref:Uncharacterized protein n=1 Tax=Phytophthora rubi TaxID=129364 RepID=A0A6A3G769_9STRA|nr:hypothetical protein PR001_g33250 [Phytophthora rubi]
MRLNRRLDAPAQKLDADLVLDDAVELDGCKLRAQQVLDELQMADDQKLDAALEQGDQLQLNADEQRADPALDEMLLDQGLNSHRSAPELDADLVLDDASCART